MACNGQVKFIPPSFIYDQENPLVGHFQSAFAKLLPPELGISSLRYLSLSFPEIPAINPTSLVTSTEAPAGECSLSLAESMATALPRDLGADPTSPLPGTAQGGLSSTKPFGKKVMVKDFGERHE